MKRYEIYGWEWDCDEYKPGEHGYEAAEWVKHSDALAAIEAARQEEREKCAQLCESFEPRSDSPYSTLLLVAEAIRRDK